MLLAAEESMFGLGGGKGQGFEGECLVDGRNWGVEEQGTSSRVGGINVEENYYGDGVAK